MAKANICEYSLDQKSLNQPNDLKSSSHCNGRRQVPEAEVKCSFFKSRQLDETLKFKEIFLCLIETGIVEYAENET